MIVNTDGGSRGNPGPGAAAAVLKDSNGVTVKEVGKYLGSCTNNEAEYHGLLLGLNMALEEGAQDLTVNMDSELVIKQLLGEYRVKNGALAVFFKQAKELEKKFKSVKYVHVMREKNKEADALVNRTLDSH